ncbi:sedoheptulokinase isoform X1 [Hemicordylus capensis]|uniref:sedoheptulokinase isoform X1 n=1 Tax=Hemicordylus capensis TaxID=884348 RepID=UPI0023049296|nr:sedoheptulokinase isoform X1 [Hemicordylus capensis]
MQMSPRAEGETGSTPAVLLGPSCVLGIDVGTTSVKTGLVSKTEHGPAVTQSCTKETRAQVENAPAGLLQVRLPAGVRVAVELAATGVPPPCRWRGQCQVPERRVTPPPRHPDSALQPHGPGCQWTERGTRPTFEPAEVSHLITWQDGHCSSDLLALLLPPRSHLSVATGFGCATIYWYMENSPGFLKPYNAAGTIQDYVVAMLCGQVRPRMSVHNAASWGYFNTTSKSWNADILEESGFPTHLLPEVVEPRELAGETCRRWHWIPEGAGVGAALGNFQCSVYSCMPESTDAVLNIGTSAQLSVPMPLGFEPSDSPDPLSPVACFPYFTSRYLAVAALLNGGNVLATFVGVLARWMAELGLEVSEAVFYPRMIRAALSQADTNLAICPTLFGERHTPERLASVTGIGASELSLSHVTRALCRGLVQNLHSMLATGRLEEAGVTRILASGSALTRNEVLRQEVEKVYPFPVVYGKDVDAAVGAALVLLNRK